MCTVPAVLSGRRSRFVRMFNHGWEAIRNSLRLSSSHCSSTRLLLAVPALIKTRIKAVGSTRCGKEGPHRKALDVRGAAAARTAADGGDIS